MNTFRTARLAPVLAGSLLLAVTGASASVYLEGDVTLNYYVADVDSEGFESVATDFYAERVVNDGSGGSGPLSLSGWFTADPSAGGSGVEAAYLPLGSIPGGSWLEVLDSVEADDVAPGEYHAHVLLQKDAFPGTFEDARTLIPRLLWRGGLEATGPLQVYPYAGTRDLGVDFAQLRNNRLDSRYTNDIVLTLYATHGYGPASSGYVLCETLVPALYAGDWRNAPGFDCTADAIPDGDYTLHLEVAEEGGRGGYSTLSGPDVSVYGGRIDGGVHDTVYVAGIDPWLLLPLGLLALLQPRRRASLTIIRIRAG